MDVIYRRELQGGLACVPDHHPGWSETQTKGDAVTGQVFLRGIGLKRDSSSCLLKLLLD